MWPSKCSIYFLLTIYGVYGPNIPIASGFTTCSKYNYFKRAFLCMFIHRFAAAYKDGSHYFVLLILTDGVITDMPDTKAAIVEVRM